MEFTYTREQLTLRERASRLAEEMMAFEDECEAGRGLPDESLGQIRDLVLAAELNAINMPSEWGGQGLSVLDQVERLYRDIRVDRIWEGTSEIQRLIIANQASKRGIDDMLNYGAGLGAEVAGHV